MPIQKEFDQSDAEAWKDDASLSSYADGWDSGCQVCGNPQAIRRHIQPSFARDYTEGHKAALGAVGKVLEPFERIWTRHLQMRPEVSE